MDQKTYEAWMKIEKERKELCTKAMEPLHGFIAMVASTSKDVEAIEYALFAQKYLEHARDMDTGSPFKRRLDAMTQEQKP